MRISRQREGRASMAAAGKTTSSRLQAASAGPGLRSAMTGRAAQSVTRSMGEIRFRRAMSITRCRAPLNTGPSHSGRAAPCAPPEPEKRLLHEIVDIRHEGKLRAQMGAQRRFVHMHFPGEPAVALRRSAGEGRRRNQGGVDQTGRQSRCPQSCAEAGAISHLHFGRAGQPTPACPGHPHPHASSRKNRGLS
jgi:hypothetical protein